MKKDSAHATQQIKHSTLRERLLFAIWLAGKVLGTDSNAEFAEAVGKRDSQLSRWVREEVRPSWETIKEIADAVRVNAAWLDDPTRPEAVAPVDFTEWLANRRAKEVQKRKRA